MFRLIPKGQQDWLRVLAFPFQAFVILAPIAYWYFMGQYGHYANNVLGPRYNSFNYIEAGKHLSIQMGVGYVICFLALMIFGFYHKAAGHRMSAYASFFFAALSVVDTMIMQYSIFAVATS
jgi:hypothetical protein